MESSIASVLEDSSSETQVAAIQKKLAAGATWAELTKEERSTIVRASRKAGLSWRKIAKRVGKRRNQHSTITQWVGNNLPDLIKGRSQKAPGTRATQQERSEKKQQEGAVEVLASREEETGLSTREALARVEQKLEMFASLAEHVNELLSKPTQEPSGVLPGTLGPSPPSPPAAIDQLLAQQHLPTSPDRSWFEFDWRRTTIQKLQQAEIESIPAEVLEKLSADVLAQLNDRMAELQKLKAMTPEERTDYLHQQQVAKKLQEAAESSTQELEENKLYRQVKKDAEEATSSSLGRLGQWNRKLEFWFCQTCKLKFPFERDGEERPKPASCPRCEMRDIEPWSPGNDPVREET